MLDAHGNEKILHTFTGGADGEYPTGVVLDAKGDAYGATTNGGDLSCDNLVPAAERSSS